MHNELLLASQDLVLRGDIFTFMGNRSLCACT